MADKVLGQPVLDPVLKLVKEPVRETASGGGKNRNQIVQGRLERQRQALSSQLLNVKEGVDIGDTTEGYLTLAIEMFDDSYAPSLTPKDLFSNLNSAPLIAPYKNGYLAEIHYNDISQLVNIISTKNDIKNCVDISRVKSISTINKDDVFAGKDADNLWEEAPSYNVSGVKKKTFIVWFVPYGDRELRKKNVENAARSMGMYGLLSKDEESDSGLDSDVIHLPDERAEYPVAIYRSKKTPLHVAERMTAPVYAVALDNKEQLLKLAASGKVTRINPPRPLISTVLGSGSDPGPLPDNIANSPIVGVIDGGRTASSYDVAEAWKAEPEIVSTSIADTKHGNRVTSLIVNGHEWNDDLSLPNLFCRVGTVQVLVKKDHADKSPEIPAIIRYIDSVIAAQPETKVWNFSLNQPCECDPFEVSELGHAITQLARKHNILPVISAGNRDGIEEKISPPADCEAAIVCAGRKHDHEGKVTSACDGSRIGFGPDGMLKPDLSWYSKVKVLGGVVDTGTSYSTPLVSRLAAHTWERMKTPTPDLVKALILNQGDLSQYNHALGWGSPVVNEHPWECPDGSVCLAWTSELKPGLEHYWHDIVLPETMLDEDGILKGTVSLTAILNPVFLNMAGVGNYFMTRLEVSLAAKNGKDNQGKDKWTNILGSDSLPKSEITARAEEFKWQPVRRHIKTFQRKKIIDPNLRLRARIYARDEWQLGIAKSDIPDLEVAFVLSFKDDANNPDTYNSFVGAMRQNVESAVIGQDVEIHNM